MRPALTPYLWDRFVCFCSSLRFARPAGHSSHDFAASPAYDPATHASHTRIPLLGAAVPYPQPVHCDAFAAENLPALHDVHRELPLIAANLPSGQEIQSKDEWAYSPGAQSSHTVALAAACWPGPHASHGVEVFESVSARPTRQGIHTAAPASECVPSGHCSQRVLAFTSTSARPASQSWQVVWSSEACVPFQHATQGVDA